MLRSQNLMPEFLKIREKIHSPRQGKEEKNTENLIKPTTLGSDVWKS